MPEPRPDLRSGPHSAGVDSAVDVQFAAVSDLSTEDLSLALDDAVLRKPRLSVAAWLAIGWMVVIVAAAVLAPVLPLDDPQQINPECVAQGPSASHPLGCDTLGRDLLSRNIWGARSSLTVAFLSILFGFIVGGGLGLAAGFKGGRIDRYLTGSFDVLLAFPQLVLALSLVAVLASGENISSTRRLMVLVLALGIVSIPIVARISRANTLSWAQREFVLAARAQGAKNSRIMWREVLPNVLPAMLSISLLGVAVVIVAEGGLSVLGVGVPLPTPSWGNIVSVGVNELERSPYIVFGAAGFIFFTVLALNYLGDVVRERFDVRESAL